MSKHIQCRISGIRERRTTAVDSDSDTTNQVAHADGQTSPEEGEARVICLGVVQLGTLDASQLGGEDDGHDDTVDGDDFAEDDGDEVLSADARGADTATDNRRAGNEDAPRVISARVVRL